MTVQDASTAVVVPGTHIPVCRVSRGLSLHPPATHKRSYPNRRPPRVAILIRQVAVSIHVKQQENRCQQSRAPQDRVLGDQSCPRHTAGKSGAIPRNIAGTARASGVGRWIAIVGDADPVTSPKRVSAAEHAPDSHSPQDSERCSNYVAVLP